MSNGFVTVAFSNKTIRNGTPCRFIGIFLKNTYSVLYFCRFFILLSFVNLAKPAFEEAVFLIRFLNPACFPPAPKADIVI